MEPSFFPAQRQLKAYSKIRDGDARREGRAESGGLLQSESLALWQNATEPNGSKQDTAATLASNGSSLAPLQSTRAGSAPVQKAGIDVCDLVAETPCSFLRPTPACDCSCSGMLFFSHHPDGPMCAHCFKHRILTR